MSHPRAESKAILPSQPRGLTPSRAHVASFSDALTSGLFVMLAGVGVDCGWMLERRQKVTRVQSTRKLGVGGGVGAGGAAGPGAGSSSAPSWASGNDEMLPRLGPLASSLFSIVS